MIRFAEWLGHWSVDVYPLATAPLILAMLAMAALRQPVHRLAVVKSLLIGLGLLAVLCAIPGWSVLHLMTAKPDVYSENVRTVTPVESLTIATQTSPTVERRPTNVEPVGLQAPQVKSPSRLNIQPWTAVGMAEFIGALGVSVWLASGWTIARNLRRRSHTAPLEVQQLSGQIAASTTSNRARVPKILASDRINVPVALGLRSPVIVLPSRMIMPGSAAVLPQSELSTVLAHELAHIQNRDLNWLALSRGLLVLFWSHPLYWLARRRMRLDQESLADAAAAELTSREQYAEQLVGWARDLTKAGTMRLASAVGLWEGASQLRQRVAILLDDRITIVREFSRKWQIGTIGLCVVVAAALSLITLRPGQGAAPPEAPPRSPDNSSAPAYEMETADGLHLPLPTPNQLAGKVFDTKHQPLARAEISVFRLRQSDSTRKLVTTLKTDENGEYRVDNFIDLAKEFPDGKFPPLRDLGDEYLQIIGRSPGYASQSQSESIQDVAQHGDSMPVVLQPAVTVRGKVTDSDGKPVAGALVSIGNGPELQNWSGANSAQTDDAGNYVITDASPIDLNKPKTFQDPVFDDLNIVEVPPALTVSHPGYATKQAVLAKAPGTQDISLERPATIEGSVVYSDSGKPASNVLVQARSEVHGPPIAVNGKLIPIIQTASVRTDANGKYKIETLPHGEYGLWAEASDWTNSGIVIQTTSGEINQAMNLKLTKGGVISVRLVDADTNKPIPVDKEMTAMIATSPLPYETAGHAIMQSDITPTTAGRFELRSPPGKMAVSSAYMEDGIARHWLSGGKPVETEVSEGQTVQVDLPMKDVSAAAVAHNVDSLYAPAIQPPATPFKNAAPAPVLAPPGAVPVADPALHPPAAAPPTSQVDPTAKKGPSLHGTITDETGAHVKGVRIILYGGIATRFRGQETQTDDAGRYRFDPLKTGAYFTPQSGPNYLFVGAKLKHPDLVPADGLSWHDIRVPDVAGEDHAFDIQMSRGGIVKGNVIDADSSKPAADFNLRVRNGFFKGTDGDDFLVYVTTNKEGEFTSEPLSPGRYVIEINHVGYQKLGSVDVRAGETSGVHLTTRQSPALEDPFTITGTAVGDDGKSMVYGGAGVRLTDGSGKLRSRGGGIDGGNVFGLGFGPIERAPVTENTPFGVGTHDIELYGNNSRFGYKLAKRTPSEPLRITDDPTKPEVENGIRYIRPNKPVEIKLVFEKDQTEAAQKDGPSSVERSPAKPATAALTGRITGPHGKPIAGATAFVTRSLPQIPEIVALPSATTDSSGNFKLEGLEPFDLAAHRKRLEELKTHSTDGNILYIPPAVLKVTAPGFASKQVVLESIPGQQNIQVERPTILEGRVVFEGIERKAANVLVDATALPTSETSDDFLSGEYLPMTESVHTDPDGKYRFTTLPPGAYDVSAFLADRDPVTVQSPESTTEKPVQLPNIVLAKRGIDDSQTEEAKQKRTAPLLTMLAEDNGYELRPSEDLRRVAPPFSPTRLKFYQAEEPIPADSVPEGPDVMTFLWSDGKLESNGMFFSGQKGGDLPHLVDSIFGLPRQQIEAPDSLLENILPGDWVIRKDADETALTSQLQNILQTELAQPIKLRIATVERSVYVARGYYTGSPVPVAWAKKYEPRPQMTSTSLPTNFIPGEGPDRVNRFLNWVGAWTKTPIISEVKDAPMNIAWRLDELRDNIKHAQAHDAGPLLADLTTPTGIEFTLEKRSIKMMFVECAAP